MAEPYFPKDEFHARWDKVYTAMREAGFETAVVWGRSAGGYERCGDVLYLTNWYSTHSGQGLDTPFTTARGFAAVILRDGHEPELQADEPWPREDLTVAGRIEWSRNTIEAVAKSLRDNKVSGPVALVGSDFFPIKYWSMLTEGAPDIEWVPCDELVRGVRKIKSARELDCMREAGRIASRALSRMLLALKAQKPESEAAAEAAYEIVKGGGRPHMIPISHGELIQYFTSEPIAGYNHTSAVEGDVVRAWVYGPMFQGYWLDPGRTTTVGRPTNSQKEMIETTAGIVEQCMAAIKPGVTARAVGELGERLLIETGAEKDQAAEKWPLFGHGVGLFFEKPYLSVPMGEADDVFEEGMVLGVEAFLARSGVGSAGFEQNVIVTADGTELLIDTPMLLWD